MVPMNSLSLRSLLAAPAIFSLAAGTAACAETGSGSQGAGSRTLVAYVTRSGNTRVIADTLQRVLAADLFEIRPAQPYPLDYEEHVERARRERDQGYEPPLAERGPDIAGYDTIFLGFPIWGETTPPPIRSYLKAYDFRGKIIRPFITHGSYGVGNSLSILTSHAPGVPIEPPFVMEADQERRTLNEIKGWLAEIKAS
ncbi:flavodoxin [Sphingosinicella xenopeptidilytica]|uniref:Flavodoxin n=1 Tax=Sphingosinicella xenopeptidilytica TaxID=364098 RepID=A0ABW3C234_SPHXN